MEKPLAADARIERWKRWWTVDDPYVRCVQGGAGQLIEDAGQLFNPLHLTDCPQRSDLPQYPWRDLSEVLLDWQREQDC